jgi:hypothetical protein
MRVIPQLAHEIRGVGLSAHWLAPPYHPAAGMGQKRLRLLTSGAAREVPENAAF